jgi:hypothetical protein
MLENEEWSTDLRRPIKIVNESGEYIETFTLRVPSELLPRRRALRTLWQAVNKDKK